METPPAPPRVDPPPVDPPPVDPPPVDPPPVDPPPVDPPPVKPPPAEPAVYTVRPGDTLWDIAERELGDPFRWPEIYKLNRGQPQSTMGVLADPDLIHPGWELRLPDDASARRQPTAPRQPATPQSPTTPQQSARPQQPNQPGQQPGQTGQPGHPTQAPEPELRTDHVGMLVIETTETGVRSARWLLKDPQWRVAEGVAAGLSLAEAPVKFQRGAAELAAQEMGLVLPNEEELHTMMWGD
ncbi:MAG: LysM peptidoglycan-binding domain-containing protein [Micromonosporaceae bacterium]|nr:LysM peptidoglycan-binding domain-containing protein [Micromonosporaceae bacterium]